LPRPREITPRGEGRRAAGAEKTTVIQTSAGNLEADIDSELNEAKASKAKG
jgi:hypothetical protein